MKIELDTNLTVAELQRALGDLGIITSYRDETLVITGRQNPPDSDWRPPFDPPPLLHDVLVTVIGEDGRPDVEMGFLRHPGQWCLTGMERTIEPLAWMRLPLPFQGKVS